MLTLLIFSFAFRIAGLPSGRLLASLAMDPMAEFRSGMLLGAAPLR